MSWAMISIDYDDQVNSTVIVRHLEKLAGVQEISVEDLDEGS